nr:hypothetical protein [Tissierella sp.]
MFREMSRYFMYGLALFSLGNAVKKKQEDIEVPTFRGVIEVKHKLQGRIRFALPLLKGNPEAFEELKSQLDRIEPILGVETNYITGSLLVNYREDIQPTLIVGILIKLLGLEERVRNKPQAFITREFKSAQDSVSLAIDEKTKGFLDLNAVFFLLFTATGISRIIKNPKVGPAGFTYLWWGYSMIKS